MLYIGIDVAKDDLVVAVCDAGEQFSLNASFPNTAAGIARLLKQLRPLGELRICLEPTSCYHLAALAALLQLPAAQVSIVNPAAARQFARATGRRGKTDRVDAQVLARYGLHCRPAPHCPPPPAARMLRAITRRLGALTDARTVALNRRHAARRAGEPRCVLTSLDGELRFLDEQRARLEEAALKLIRATEPLAAGLQLLLSVKGIGRRSALAILGELAVLPPDMQKQQWVAHCGLDPRPADSGQVSGPRRISRQGNVHLRRALYMPALVAAYKPGAGQAYYRAMLARGKKPLQALVALMRKLLLAIWGMFHTQTAFDPQRFYRQPA